MLAPTFAPPDSRPLIGRARELERLQTGLSQRTPIVVVGEAGVGKTSLLTAAAVASGRRVHTGGGLSSLDTLPYVALSRALPSLDATGDLRWVARWVEKTVGDGVVLIDDVQWADPASRAVVALLSGRVRLAAAIRQGDPRAGGAAEQLETAGFEVLDIDPLPPEDAHRLAQQLRPDLDDMARGRLLERSGGNPLLLHELASTGDPSPSLRLALGARLRALSRSARYGFAILSLLGRPTAPGLLSRRALTELTAAGLIRHEGDMVSVRHALLAETVLADLSDRDRRRFHGRLARLVEEPVEAARHHAAAGERGRAYTLALAGLDAAHTPGERAELLALAAASAPRSQAARLRLEAAGTLVNAADPAGAQTLLSDLEVESAADRARLELLHGRVRLALGDADGARAALEQGLVIAPAGSAVEVDLQLLDAFIAVSVGPSGRRSRQRIMELATRANRLAHDRRVSVAEADRVLGVARYYAGEPDWATPLERSVRRARADGDHELELRARLDVARASLTTLPITQVVELMAQGAERAKRLKLLGWEHEFTARRIAAQYWAGDCSDVVAGARMLLQEPTAGPIRDRARKDLGLALVDLGRFDEARALVQTWRPTARSTEHELGAVLDIECELGTWSGRPTDALRASDELLQLPMAAAVNEPIYALGRAWTCIDAGIDAGRLARWPASQLVFGVGAELRGVHHWADGQRSGHPADYRAAARSFRSAAKAWAGHYLRQELRCLWGAGECLRLAGDEAGARILLLATEPRAEAAGMLPLLRRIQRSLRLSGVRRAAPRSRAAQGLTTRELEVLKLAGQGMTNAEVARQLGVSRPTVASLMASAEAKLGAVTRAQAIAMAAELEPG